MANRSFVYTANNYENPLVDALGLSEYEYQIHPLYLLLVSFNSEVISSNTVEEEEKTAIVGDFEQGKTLVLKFLELILTYKESYHNDSFEEFITTSKELLTQRNSKHVILENFEIIEVDGRNFVPGMIKNLGDAKNEVEELYAKHLKGTLSGEDISETSFYGEFDDVCTEYGQLDAEDIDWSDFWTDTLYYDLKD